MTIDEIFTKIDVKFPYVLHNGQKGNGFCKWEVKKDVSGIYMNEGELVIRVMGAGMEVDAPNRSVEIDVIDIIK